MARIRQGLIFFPLKANSLNVIRANLKAVIAKGWLEKMNFALQFKGISLETNRNMARRQQYGGERIAARLAAARSKTQHPDDQQNIAINSNIIAAYLWQCCVILSRIVMSDCKPAANCRASAVEVSCDAPIAQRAYNSIDAGSSIKFLNAFRNCAPTAPSTTLWSQVSVTVIMVAICISPFRTMTLSSPAPTERIAP